ncbi:phage regulatory CII family protein [Desulfovibrio sp. ZJ369]|uniref:phage regulatory CII family protein n=1 Tax=Desulfovibrio sp. ZJ369 TaxID=2709793 RepID=UPI0013EC2291|nr:phage regulatory CII family protein [Desulfovibrio sp. ZJ369]
MRQLSLIEDILRLSGVMAAIRAAMREAAGAEESEGRKLLTDRLNEVSHRAGIKLTAGNTSGISKATLDKWLSPTDTSHPPSILALLAFCKATGNLEPLRVAAQALGVDLMTREDRRLRDYAQAILDERAARQRKNKLEKEL